MSKGILVYIQHSDGIIFRVGFELISEAFRLARKLNCGVYAAAAGGDFETIKKQLEAFDLQKLFFISLPKGYEDDVNAIALGVARTAEDLKPDIILIGATRQGRALAPCVAVRLRTGLTADCTELSITGKNELLQIRPAFDEKVLAYIVTKTRPQMATVRPGIMKISDRSGLYGLPVEKTTVSDIDLNCEYHIKSVTPEEPLKVDIRKSKLLVVLGAAVRAEKDIEIFAKWAKSMGGEIACSRKLVERGWFTVERQVGLSGNSVNAACMITIGVSGSIQFQAGIKNVKKIIAVNIDKEAPIFKAAHIPVLLDLQKLLDAIR